MLRAIFHIAVFLVILLADGTFSKEPNNKEILRIKNFLADEMFGYIKEGEFRGKAYLDSAKSDPEAFDVGYGGPDTSYTIKFSTRADFIENMVEYRKKLDCPIPNLELYVFEDLSGLVLDAVPRNLIVARSSDSLWIITGNLYTDTGLYRYPLEKYFDYVNRELVSFPFHDLDSAASIAVGKLPLVIRSTIQSGISSPRVIEKLDEIPGGKLHADILSTGWRKDRWENEPMYSFLSEISPPVARKVKSGFIVEFYYWEWEHDIMFAKLKISRNHITIIETKKLGVFGIDFPRWILAPEGSVTIGR